MERKHKAKIAASVVLVRERDGKEEVLLQKRGGDAPGAGNWDTTAGGHVDSEDESFTMAAHREALEEIGITFDENDAILTTIVHSKNDVGQYVDLTFFWINTKANPRFAKKINANASDGFLLMPCPKTFGPKQPSPHLIILKSE